MIDVLMAPASIRNPTTTMKPWKSNLIGIGPTRYIEMPLIRLLKYCGPHVVRDERVREKRHERGEEQRVDEDHHPGLHQVRVLRVLELAIDLRQ